MPRGVSGRNLVYVQEEEIRQHQGRHLLEAQERHLFIDAQILALDNPGKRSLRLVRRGSQSHEDVQEVLYASKAVEEHESTIWARSRAIPGN